MLNERLTSETAKAVAIINQDINRAGVALQPEAETVGSLISQMRARIKAGTVESIKLRPLSEGFKARRLRRQARSALD